MYGYRENGTGGEEVFYCDYEIGTIKGLYADVFEFLVDVGLSR